MQRVILFLSTLALSLAASAADQVRLLPRQVHMTSTVVEGTGSWVQKANGVAPPIPLPLINATHFKCSKLTKSCTEAVAALFTDRDDPRTRGLNLFSTLSEYTIASWTNTRIVAISRLGVADVTLEIDLAKKSATRRHQETKARGNLTADPNFIVEWTLR